MRETVTVVARNGVHASVELHRLPACRGGSGADLPEEREEEAEMRSVRVLRRYLDPAHASVRQRLEIVRAAASGESDVDSERGVLGATAVLQNVARTDPNSWVRGHADDAVERLSTYLE